MSTFRPQYVATLRRLAAEMDNRVGGLSTSEMSLRELESLRSLVRSMDTVLRAEIDDAAARISPAHRAGD